MTPAPQGRIAALDVTRGIAVMGILAMNIVGFAWPEAAYITPHAGGGTTPADLAAWATCFLLVDSKMRGLFSMLFGASALLVIDRARAAGADPARRHFARMASLALFGLAHYYLLWWGDILFLYALAGCAIWFARDLSASALARGGAALIGIGVTLAAANELALRAAAGSASDVGRAYAAQVAGLAARAPETLTALRLYRSDYGTILHHRLIDGAAAPLTDALPFLPETIGLMLIGMALYRSGLFAGGWSAARRGRWAAGAIAVGLAGNALLLWWQLASGLDGWVVLTASLVWSVPFDVAMTLGYAAAIVTLADHYRATPLAGRIGAAGRAAFSNYLGTSLVMTTIFYGYGGGLFGQVPRAWLYAFVPVAWAAMLAWSQPWLGRFRYGPMEWLWRSVARGRWQPMLRDVGFKG